MLGERLKGVVAHVSLSHEVNPEAREYERTSATVFNAAAMPIAVEYLSELEQRLPIGAGPAGVSFGRSHGPDLGREAAAAGDGDVGPGGRRLRIGQHRAPARHIAMLTFDMGGTTTDVCLIVDGQAEMTDGRMLGDKPLRQPMLAVHSIGAGGGSIVRNGPGGLTVGPESAGSEPGPACYGRGGTEPTITDANAVLGYLNPETKLGDRIGIDIKAAKRVIEPIARTLGLSLTETALGIIKVANATMARALRRVTVERGIDGRDCTLLAFGGGGPMHAAGLADLYGIAEVVVPSASSAFSALGCLTADFSFLQQQTLRAALDGIDLARVSERIGVLIDDASAPLIANGVATTEIQVELVALMRYAAQNDAIPVPFTLPLDVTKLKKDFLARHHELFGYATSESCVIESVRVQARRPSTTVVSRPATAVRAVSTRRAHLLVRRLSRYRRPHHRPRLADRHRQRPGHHRRRMVNRGGPAGLAGKAGCFRQSVPDAEGGMKLDPFVVEVIRHGLSAAAEEMSLVMTRSARSPLLREAGDLSSAITDGRGGLVGQGRDIPIHLGAMAYTIPELLKVVPRRQPERRRRADLQCRRRSAAIISTTSRSCAPSSSTARSWRSRSASRTGPISAAPGPAAILRRPSTPSRRRCAFRRY